MSRPCRPQLIQRLAEETPGLTDNTASASSTSLASTSSTTPPSSYPFTGFNDPFAPRSVAVRDAAFTPTYNPTSTSPGYRYSPTAEARRMSETPLAQRTSPSTHRLDQARRPSASGSRGTRPFRPIYVPLPGTSPTFPLGASSSVPTRPESPHGTPMTSPARPRLLRYRSSPSRSTGLGLQIVIRPQSPLYVLNTTESDSPGLSPSSMRRFRANGWTSVDVVDPLAAGDDGTPSSTTITPSLLRVERRASRSPMAELNIGRSRFESVDSALPLFAEKLLKLPQNGMFETFPRRGSLAVLSRTPLGPWAVKAGDEMRIGVDGHWSERRGSWAEGWKK